MKNNDIVHVGEYRLRTNNAKHVEPFWASRVRVNGQYRTVVDAAGATLDGRNVIKLLPYGMENHALDGLLLDGDLLGYVQEPLCVDVDRLMRLHPNQAAEVIGGIIKGRVSHAEVGYADADGKPKQVSLWCKEGAIRPYDRPFHIDTCNDAISVYRASLAGYGIDQHHEALLKAEVRRWKDIVQPIYFPTQTMNTDPVDFTTIEELGHIAAGFVRHAPSDRRPPFDFRLNCVQWSTLVFSLAVCYPLSRPMLERSGLLADYERNWAGRLGFADEGLTGLDELPLPFYTVPEAVENTLDLYLPDRKAEIMGKIDLAVVAAKLSEAGIRLDQRITMPSAFMVENRLRAVGIPRHTKTVFKYVATAVPEEELIRVTQEGMAQ